MKVMDRKVLGKFPRPHTVPAGCPRPSQLQNLSRSVKSQPSSIGDLSPNAFSDAGLKRDMHPSMAQHKYNEVMLKHKKFETTRERDQKYIRLMVEHKEDERQARMTRLVENLTGHNGRNPDYQASLQLTEFLANREATVWKHYLDWDKNVFGPNAKKAFMHVNRHKFKRLSFNLDDPSFKLYVDTTKDPPKRQLVQNASEKSFQTEAEMAITGDKPCGPPVDLLSSQSRPVLEPDLWGMYGSSVFGRFSELLDPRCTKPSLRRSGRNVHLPLPAQVDGCGEVAGTKHSRLFGHHDMGILQSARDRGEAQVFKNEAGASSGAPAQDHFTYETGPEIVNLDFPPGKRVFPGPR